MPTDLDRIIACYVKLALALDQHLPGYIDAYFGPVEWRAAAGAAGPRPLPELAQEAVELSAAIAAAPELAGQRRDFLAHQARAMRTSLRVLAGERLPLVEAVAGLYDITPIRIKLSNRRYIGICHFTMEVVKVVVQRSQQLVGVWRSATFVDATADSQAVLDDDDGIDQLGGAAQMGREMQRMAAHRLGRLDQAAIRIGPATNQEQPVLNDHGEQFGVDFTQDSPWVFTARGIDLAMALPQLEQ